MECTGQEERSQSKKPGHSRPPADEVCGCRAEHHRSHHPPHRRTPRIDACNNAQGISPSRPQHRLPRSFELEGRRAGRTGVRNHEDSGRRADSQKDRTSVSAPDERRSRGDTSAGTDRPDEPARPGSQLPAKPRDRAPGSPDRMTHKQRVARPRSPNLAPRVRPGHHEAGPPPPGRVDTHDGGELRPSRPASFLRLRISTVRSWPGQLLHSRTDCMKGQLWKSVTTQQKRCDGCHKGLWKTAPRPRKDRARPRQTGRR